MVIGLAGCSTHDQERAKQEGREDARKASDEVKKAGGEIKAAAKDLSHKVDDAIQPGGEPASEKMSQAELKMKKAAARAGTKVDHAALLAEVKTKLASDAGLSTLSNVDVSVVGSVVTLSGSAGSQDQKQAAGTAASQVEGVTEVRNQLRVRP